MKEYNKTEFEDMHRNNASLVQREVPELGRRRDCCREVYKYAKYWAKYLCYRTIPQSKIYDF